MAIDVHSIGIQRRIAVASITIDIPDDRLQKLQQLARENGISPEDLLRASTEDWLTYPKSEFIKASNYVSKKNAELYQRLAWHVI